MVTSDANNETELLHELRRGDHNAFNLLYNQYKTELAIRILRMVRAEELAEELLQDLFMRIWANRERIDPEKPFKAYLYQIAKNLVIDLLRRASKEQHIHRQIIAVTSELYQHIEENIFQKENEAMLRQAIDQLPPQRKKIFVHCKLEGKSYKEVAELYSISTTTVNDHVQKSMQFLKKFVVSKLSVEQLILLIWCIKQ